MQKMIDACAASQQAVDLLLRKLQNKKFQVHTLRQFLYKAKSSRLTNVEKELICDQAIIILEQFYAHLPFKRALYAVNPVQRLKLIRAAIVDDDSPEPDDLSFHAGVIGAFTSLRDVHTVYCLPKPFAGTVAFLPFFVDYYQGRNGARRFVVTRMLEGFDPDPGYFCKFSEITAWNGVAIGKAVDQLAQAIPGGNQATRTLRGTMRLSARQLTTTPPPMEDVVYVKYIPYVTEPEAGEMGKPREVEERVVAVPWYVGEGLNLETLDHVAGETKSGAAPSASCIQVSDFVNLRKLISAKTGKSAKPVPEVRPGFPRLAFPEVFDVHHTGEANWAHSLTAPKYPNKKFGYIRIRRFPDTYEASVNDFQSILTWFNDQELATDGLLLDIHSNPGGNIVEAESMLQLLSAKPIKPARFHYPNTEAIQNILSSISSPDRIDATISRLPAGQGSCVSTASELFEAWANGVFDGAGSGSTLTDGKPITKGEKANERGQVYHAPIALLTDACTYSAADIFAGGFQDHHIGIVIGMDKNTGGGGASSWRHAKELLQLKPLTGLPIKRLPKHAAFGLAIQRSARVKEYNGQPVEDRGVKSDIHYKRTFEDILHDSKYMMRFACGVLAEQPVYKLNILDKFEFAQGGVKVTIRASGNYDKLVFQLDDHPALVVPMVEKQRSNKRADVKDKTEETSVIERTFFIPIEHEYGHHRPKEIEVQGFVWHRTADERKFDVVARKRARLKYPKNIKAKTAAR